MKTLYTDDDRWTPDAIQLADEAKAAVLPIMRKYLDMGYKSHEVEHIMSSQVTMTAINIRHKL